MVQFNEVEIIEFPIILGDHPSCEEGPALQMATSCQSRIVVDVEEYEAVRSCCRRYSRDLVLSCEERYQRLQQNGIELNNNIRKSKRSSPTKSKKNRVTTMKALDEQHEQRLCDINDQLEKLMARLESLNTEATKSSCCDSYETETSCPPTKRATPRSDRYRVTVMARCA